MLGELDRGMGQQCSLSIPMTMGIEGRGCWGFEVWCKCGDVVSYISVSERSFLQWVHGRASPLGTYDDCQTQHIDTFPTGWCWREASTSGPGRETSLVLGLDDRISGCEVVCHQKRGRESAELVTRRLVA